ncbi:MAG: hypothetical protein K0R54_2280 [Clostridiaceae bacterium]|jgi:hypothetical protein|nr:hypothetical protein [Clostridiaceae bacterium]
MKFNELKKTHNGAMIFSFARNLRISKNMQAIAKKCKSHEDLFLKVIFLCFIFIFNSTIAYADTGKGLTLYYKLAGGAVKLILIFKGAFEVVQACINGDVQGAKKNLIGYLLAFGSLYLLPTAFDEIEIMFRD